MLQALNPRARSLFARCHVNPCPLANACLKEGWHFRNRFFFTAREVLFHLVAVGIHCSGFSC